MDNLKTRVKIINTTHTDILENLINIFLIEHNKIKVIKIYCYSYVTEGENKHVAVICFEDINGL